MVGLAPRAILLTAAILSAFSQQTTFTHWKDDNSPWTTFPRPITRVAVIGAGPAGLQAAAHLLATNLSVRLFERAPSPGGNWFYTEETPVREVYPNGTTKVPKPNLGTLPASHYYEEGDDGLSLEYRWKEHWQPRPVWSNLHTNSPASFMKLPGVEYPANTPWSVPIHDLERHVRAYASLHGLNINDRPSGSHPYAPVTSYSTRVEAIEKCNETAMWKLTLRRLQWLPESNRLRGDLWTEEFDAVVVATGHYTTAYVPPIKGIDDWSTATEEGQYSMYHSQSFRHPERYIGKTVLIVGASISATEIARTIAPFTHRLLASVRPNKYRDGYGLDILLAFPDKTELVSEISYFEPLDRHDAGIKGGKIWLTDGSAIEGIDEIILATGYRHNDFLPDLVNPRTKGNLHWTGHYIQDPTLAYMLTSRMWTIPGYQGYAFAKVWTGKARLPSRERMWADYLNKKYDFGSALDLMLEEATRRLYVAWLNSESLELGGQFVEPMPVNVREELTYFVNARWKKDWMSHENWTRFDDLPSSEWPTPGPPSDGLEYKVLSW
ncbi:FAD/NAD-P-binding domain-containing protein [Mycena polygramma]|nr:FAD/NAD-P-binding domain-containing protein [Mycena polygramma]